MFLNAFSGAGGSCQIFFFFFFFFPILKGVYAIRKGFASKNRKLWEKNLSL